MGIGGHFRKSAALFAALFGFLICFECIQSKPIDVAIVDAAEGDPSIYNKPFIESLEKTGCRVSYKSLSTVIDSLSVSELSKYKAVFFILSIEFLNSIESSHLSFKVLSLLHNYACLAGKIVGIAFPTIFTRDSNQLLMKCAPLLNALGMEKTLLYGDYAWLTKGASFETEREKQQKTFLWHLKLFMTHPLETRPLGYHTTLSAPHAGIDFFTDFKDTFDQRAQEGLFFMPLESGNVDEAVLQTLPYGMYWYNEKYKNHIFFTYTSAISFAGISENFHVCPMDVGLRQQMLDLVQRMIGQLMALGNTTSKQAACQLGKKLASQPAVGLRYPSIVWESGFFQPAKARRVAWMDLDVFYQDGIKGVWKGQEREAARKNLIDYVYEAKLDALWLTINPHMYYSKRARLAGVEKQHELWQALVNCCNLLKQGAIKYRVKTPSILIGYEIANNLYKPNLPKHCAVDLYGQVYEDLPSPVDVDFWNSEIVQPLHLFVSAWNKNEILKKYPLGGIVLDLEMYCRKKSSMFLSSMTFNGTIFNNFMKAQGQKKKISVPRKDRILHLMRSQSGTRYYNFLEKEAEKIGKFLQKEFVRDLHNPLIMCYLPQINVSWFYKGLYKGLTHGSADPLYLLTFNSAFLDHADWFAQNKIPVNHASVLLLSKIKNNDDFEMAKKLGQRHPTVWFNKFSRFVDPKGVTEWTNVEQPSIEESAYSQLAAYIGGL